MPNQDGNVELQYCWCCGAAEKPFVVNFTPFGICSCRLESRCGVCNKCATHCPNEAMCDSMEQQQVGMGMAQESSTARQSALPVFKFDLRTGQRVL